MAKSLPGQPETSCSGRPPTILDIERGIKREKKGLGTRTIKHLSLRMSPRAKKIQRVLRHFPTILLFFLMTSSLYPKEALTLYTGFLIFIIVIIYRKQLIKIKLLLGI